MIRNSERDRCYGRRGMAATHLSATCPHCRKPFEAELLEPDTERTGVKCPHCNLFVPLERADEPEPARRGLGS
jgi:DNA-directed RNA polymerase subunit RPC12/RpoP